MGVSFALKRKRVLIVDCDLRHGSSSMFVGMPKNEFLIIILPEIDNWKVVVEKSASPQFKHTTNWKDAAQSSRRTS